MTGSTDIEYDYDSDNRVPRALEELLDVVRNASLLRALVRKEVTVRYKRSLLGVTWTAAGPLLLLLVLTLAFASVFKTTPSYPAFVMPGLLVWNLFAQVTTIIGAETSSGMALWKRVRLPKTIMPVSTIITSLVNLFLIVVPYLVVLLIARWHMGWALFTLLPVAMLLGAFTLGVGLLLASVALYFPDVVHLYQTILSAWFFITPVIYPESTAPPYLKLLLRLNPMARFVEAFRAPLYRNAAATPEQFAILAGAALLTLAAGWTLYTHVADDIPYRS